MNHAAREIAIWPVAKLRPYEKNSRTHSPDQINQIAESIEAFGFTNPILVDSSAGIIAGHGRLAAATKLGLETVPVIVLDHLSDAQRRAYIIADNKLALNAGWDLEVLASEIAALDGEGFDLDLLGFSDDELAELMMEPEQLPPQGDADEVPEPAAEPRVVRGEVYILGKHRLMCGDSTDVSHADLLLQKQAADLVFTDPPYGVSYQNNMSKRFDVIENDDKILNIASLLYALMKNDSAAIVWTSQQVYPEWRAQFSSYYKSTIIWAKGGGGMGDLTGDFAPNYEMALFCTKGRPMFQGARPMAVWDISKDGASEYVHPTQKPVALAERGIELLCPARGLVLDLFGGSGSTLIAAEKTGRIARVMELDPIYCGVILDRWEKFTGKKAHREDGTPWSEIRGL